MTLAMWTKKFAALYASISPIGVPCLPEKSDLRKFAKGVPSGQLPDAFAAYLLVFDLPPEKLTPG